MSDFDSLFTIRCGRCGVESPVARWVNAPVTGDLPAGRFQCPAGGCTYAFERRLVPSEFTWRGPEVKCIAVERVL